MDTRETTPLEAPRQENREIAKLRRAVEKASADSKRWAERAGEASRQGATRARITTINANWSQAAERRNELKAMLKAAEAR